MMRDASGRKREWQSMESAGDDSSSSGSSAHACDVRRAANGEVIENEMKRLRLAHDYDDEPMDVESSESAVIGSAHGDHNYSAKNNLLRECHYLRQLRKFQSERLSASFFERRGVDTSTQLLPLPRRY